MCRGGGSFEPRCEKLPPDLTSKKAISGTASIAAWHYAIPKGKVFQICILVSLLTCNPALEREPFGHVESGQPGLAKGQKTGARRGPGWMLYLPCDQVLEAAQLVLVLWVFSAVLVSEEGLWGTGRDLRFPASQVGHMIHLVLRQNLMWTFQGPRHWCGTRCS